VIRVVFMGTPDYAKTILEALFRDDAIEVVAVFTQPDKPVGRHKTITPSSVKVVAQQYNVPIFQPTSLRREDFSETIRNLHPDYIVVAAFGQLLPQAILDIAPCINLHASILPAYRGASPIQEALLHGDNRTGVTAMLMDAGMDTGAILAIEEVAITPETMAQTLFVELAEVAAQLTLNVLHSYSRYTPHAQHSSKASYCTKITKEQGAVTFDNAQDLFNKYRAFTPWPGLFLESGLKLLSLGLIEVGTHHSEGEIVAIAPEYIDVGCTLGLIRLFEVQPPSKKAMKASDYIRGKRLGVGDRVL